MHAKIFISYRREDASADARSIYQHLERHFGSQSLFMDVDTIQMGQDFRSALDDTLSKCKIALIILGQEWLDARDAQGNRRLDDPNDFVRLEITKALQRDIPVIPVLVGSARLPQEDERPDDLKPLVGRQAAIITHNNFPHDMEGLQEEIQRVVKPGRSWRLIAGVATLLAASVAGGYWYYERLQPQPPSAPRTYGDPQPQPPSTPKSLGIPGTEHKFAEKNGHLVSTANGNPLCPTPPGWRTGCYAIESEYRQNWRNTPDGYVASGKKVKTFSNRSERIFQILGTKHAFYVDDGHLFHYPTATILCPWPKAGVAKCHKIEAKYENKWRNTPEGFIADGRAFNAIEVMRDIRQGLF